MSLRALHCSLHYLFKMWSQAPLAAPNTLKGTMPPPPGKKQTSSPSPHRPPRKQAMRRSPPGPVKKGPMDHFVKNAKGASPYCEEDSQGLEDVLKVGDRSESLPLCQYSRPLGPPLTRRPTFSSQDPESLSQAGFSALSNQSQDWLAGVPSLHPSTSVGVESVDDFVIHGRHASPPPQAANKKRKHRNSNTSPGAAPIIHDNNIHEDVLVACVGHGA